jgi:hypothetical protein
MSIGWAIALMIFFFFWGKNHGHDRLASKIRSRIDYLDGHLFQHGKEEEIKIVVRRVLEGMYEDLRR